MTTPRQPVPTHARDAIEDSRDAAMHIQSSALAAAEVARFSSEGAAPEAWRVVSRLLASHAEIVKLSTFIVEELQSIEGIMRSLDTPALSLIEERRKRAR